MLPWKPEFRSDLAQNIRSPFPPPNDASDGIKLQLDCWSKRYQCLKELTDAPITKTSPCNEDPLTPPLLYSKTGVYKGIHYFLIFALKHRLWVLV